MTNDDIGHRYPDEIEKEDTFHWAGTDYQGFLIKK
jgi:hypothetical protein